MTLFYLLARRIDWSEVFGLTAFFALFELGLILVGGGVFREAPINYFGDVVLFTGWCLLTASLWTLALPLLMLLLFMYVHIPPLDEYLAERYGEEFQAYGVKTRRLVPYVW